MFCYYYMIVEDPLPWLYGKKSHHALSSRLFQCKLSYLLLFCWLNFFLVYLIRFLWNWLAWRRTHLLLNRQKRSFLCYVFIRVTDYTVGISILYVFLDFIYLFFVYFVSSAHEDEPTAAAAVVKHENVW